MVLNKFNINLLSTRLTVITNWMIEEDSGNVSTNVKGLPIGYFGASTGAAACIEACVSSYSDKIYAIVSRGGRPDLASSDSIKNVKAATMLIVGANDSKEMMELNKKALKQLKNAKNKDLVMIPNAGHLFDEEEGVIEKVATIASQWFTKNINYIN